MQDLDGKNAFITGGARGIGRAMAAHFVRAGVHVALADVDGAAAKEAAAELDGAGARAISVECDVTKAESVEQALVQAVEKLGPIHVLCNNAGVVTASEFERTTRSDWEWMLNVNVLGVVNVLQAMLPHMRLHAEPAHIVNTASMAGHIPVARMGPYAASKFAVVGLTECLAEELGDSPIGVSVLCPGIVNTGLATSSRSVRPHEETGEDRETQDLLEQSAAAGSDPDEIGALVVDAVRAGDFYIFSHPEFEGLVRKRTARIHEAFERAGASRSPRETA